MNEGEREPGMSYDALVIAAHPDDAETQMGGTLAKLSEAEDQYYGRMLGVAYAEIYRSAAPLLIEDPTVFRPAIHG
jgi:hypothetical protein